jgi:LacI family transcriptional regulator
MTIYDIAKKAGVSIGTVDRVVHHRPGVSEKTAKKVRRLIEKVGYKPSGHASGLASSKKRYCFGVLMPQKNQDNSYWAQPAKGIENRLQTLNNPKVSLRFYYFNKYVPASFARACHQITKELSQLDGLVAAPVMAEPAQAFFETLPKTLPMVFFDSYLPNNNIPTVGHPAKQSGQTSARLMDLAIGHTHKIGCLNLTPEDTHVNDRLKGFSAYFSDKPKATLVTETVSPSQSPNAFLKGAKALLKKYPDLKGLFVPHACVHETAAIKQKEGFPFIIGYDTLPKNTQCLKTGTIDVLISQAPFEQGSLAFDMLYRTVVLKEKTSKEHLMPVHIYLKENL